MSHTVFVWGRQADRGGGLCLCGNWRRFFFCPKPPTVVEKKARQKNYWTNKNGTRTKLLEPPPPWLRFSDLQRLISFQLIFMIHFNVVLPKTKKVIFYM